MFVSRNYIINVSHPTPAGTYSPVFYGVYILEINIDGFDIVKDK